ncbi:hypothetical protein LJR045_002067 [Microbacterium sp. LjRoot45]|uniref:hypothetical protein n=1 Tax=Microbacterium sp. LjRoot45 TaxID=3342329 RepID=UPI003ECCE94D
MRPSLLARIIASIAVVIGSVVMGTVPAYAADVHPPAVDGTASFPLLAALGMAIVLVFGLVLVLRLGSIHKKRMREEEAESPSDDA